jgi:hypothetical protein
MRLEVGAEHLELRHRRQVQPVHDRDHRLGGAAPLPERPQHAVELGAAAEQRPHPEPLGERLHHRQVLEDLVEHVAVGHPGRRLGVVLDVADLVGDEAVQPAGR